MSPRLTTEFRVLSGDGAAKGKLSPRLAALKPGDEVQVSPTRRVSFVLDEVPDCETPWMLATELLLARICLFCNKGRDVARF